MGSRGGHNWWPLLTSLCVLLRRPGPSVRIRVARLAFSRPDMTKFGLRRRESYTSNDKFWPFFKVGLEILENLFSSFLKKSRLILLAGPFFKSLFSKIQNLAFLKAEFGPDRLVSCRSHWGTITRRYWSRLFSLPAPPPPPLLF